MTNITIRIDENVKKEAESLFNELGISMSGAVNIFFRQAIRERAIPFPIRAKTIDEKYFNPYNIEILKESMKQLDNGQIIIKTMEELEDMAND